jgi:hypothetical protein
MVQRTNIYFAFSAEFNYVGTYVCRRRLLYEYVGFLVSLKDSMLGPLKNCTEQRIKKSNQNFCFIQTPICECNVFAAFE